MVIGLIFYAFIVFHKARKYLAENPRRCSLFPDTFIGRRPINHYGFYNNSPMCSQDYSANQMPAPAYTVHNSQQFYSSEIVNPPPSIGAGVVLEVKPQKY
uniref:Vesicular, overexpressed in cancer, prosurvival protein 1 n=1 Tax=Panagrolaimus davidi TaxID=227884 RepID=A0A914QTR2_9BILA